jgi:hypothetical protein
MTDETSRGNNTTAPESHSDSYNGWTNRETWAVALHINNDQGWQESVHEALRGIPDVGDPRWAMTYDDSNDPSGALRQTLYRQAGEIIRENVEEVLDPSDVLAEGDDAPEIFVRNLWPVAQDIGSLWRVNWTELGAAFLSDLEDES